MIATHDSATKALLPDLRLVCRSCLCSVSYGSMLISETRFYISISATSESSKRYLDARNRFSASEPIDLEIRRHRPPRGLD